jgi:AraC-like DNA-binding protein
MAAILERISANSDESFSIGIFQDNLDKSTWHYHDNYEICFITEGTGKRIVADSILEFQPGDLVFLGPNLPHVWIADKDVITISNRSLEMVYLQFKTDVLTSKILSIPEFRYVVKALEASERGIQVMDKTLDLVSEIMLQLPYTKGFDRMIGLFNILNIIGESHSNVQLASKEYLKGRFSSTDNRISEIHNYLMQHYKEEINLNNLANLVHMAPGSLCRFFKSNMELTLFEYLNKIKIEFACKLLMDKNISVLDVCFDSGFNNLSHFNKQFKKFTGARPNEYRKRFKYLY